MSETLSQSDKAINAIDELSTRSKGDAFLISEFEAALSEMRELPASDTQVRVVVKKAAGSRFPVIRGMGQGEILRREKNGHLRYLLFRSLSDSDFNIAYQSAHALGKAAEESDAVLQRLARLVGSSDEKVRGHAIRAIGLSGRSSLEVIDALTSVVTNPASPSEILLAAEAAKTLGEMGPAAKKAVRPLLANLTSIEPANPREEYARKLMEENSAAALGKITAGTDEAVGTLLAVVTSGQRESMRKVCAEALGHVGRPAVSALVDVLKNNKDEGTIILCAKALELIGPEARKAVPVLNAIHKKSDDWKVQYPVGDALQAIGEPEPVTGFELLSEAVADFREAYGPAESLRRLGKIKAIGAMREAGDTENVVSALRKAIKIDNLVLQSAALLALSELGPDAAPAAPELLELLGGKDPLLQQEAVAVLATSGSSSPEAIEALCQFVLNNNESTASRKMGILALVAFNEKDGSVSRYLADKIVRDEDRIQSLGILSVTMAGPIEIVPVLSEMLKSCSDYEEALHILDTFGNMDPLAEGVIPAMVEGLINTQHLSGFMMRAWKVNDFIAERLRKLSEGKPEVSARIVDCLMQTLKDCPPSPQSRSYIEALGGMGEDAAAAASMMIERFSNPEDIADLASAFAKMPETAREHLPVFIDALGKGDARARMALVELFSVLSPHTPEALDALKAAGLDPNEIVRQTAQHEISKRPEDDPERFEALLSNLGDDTVHVGFHAAQLLAKMLKEDPSILAPLVSNLWSEDKATRSHSLDAINISGTGHEEALDGLLHIVGLTPDPWDYSDQKAAVECIGRIGPAAMKALPVLRALLEPAECEYPESGNRAQVAGAAALAIGRITTGSSAEVRTLLRLLESKNSYGMHEACVSGLGAIGRAAKGAAPAIISYMRNCNTEGRKVPIEALKQICPEDEVVALVVGGAEEAAKRAEARRKQYEAATRRLGRSHW